MSKNITLAALRLKQADDALNAALGEFDDPMVIARLKLARSEVFKARNELVLTWEIG